MQDEYAQAIQELEKQSGEDTNKIPDQVKKYTHDINGKKLPCEYVQLNQRYVHHLNKIPRQIKAKNDYFALCFGYPGVGKSLHLQKTCTYLNADFGLKDIVFTVEQLDEWVTNAKIGSVGVFDEADAMAGNSYDEVLQALIRNSKRMRTKRLILFFATPTMRDMHHYWAFRARMVIYCYIPKNTYPENRGWVHLWHDQDLIADLFARMKKSYSENSTVYKKAFSTLRNNYNGQQLAPDWHINEQEYEKKKEDARKELEKTGAKTAKQAVREYRDKTIHRLDRFLYQKEANYTQAELAQVFDLSRNRYSEIIKELS